MKTAILIIAAAGLLSACALGPDYQRPPMALGDHYAHAAAPEDEAWVPVDAAQAIPRGEWWRGFGDARLNDMMDALQEANFDLARAQAAYVQAQAALQSSRAAYYPSVGAQASASRSGDDSQVVNQFNLTGSVSWELDLWGRTRSSVQASEAGLHASEADLADTRLSLQSSLAQTYFRLRGLDADADLLRRTVSAYERSLAINRDRLAAGVGERADVSIATTQLENARAQRESLVRQRIRLENALAVLQGRAPSHFQLDADPDLPARVPVMPAGLPIQLLQRRPDVAAAEQRVRKANAEIGVAQAAWFPDLVLSAQDGFRSGEWARWLSAPAQFWTLGPALALSLLDGGARRAQLDSARAAYDAQAAQYRQTVLTALQEVEDALASMDGLAREAAIQQRALAAARESLALVRNQYAAGLVDYLSVVQLETTAFSAERTALSLKAEQLQVSVQLIAALGGGWKAEFSTH